MCDMLQLVAKASDASVVTDQLKACRTFVLGSRFES
jgi:hypothetical protein